jgi:hypothetical protein
MRNIEPPIREGIARMFMPNDIQYGLVDTDKTYGSTGNLSGIINSIHHLITSDGINSLTPLVYEKPKTAINKTTAIPPASTLLLKRLDMKITEDAAKAV